MRRPKLILSVLAAFLLASGAFAANDTASWSGVLRDASGQGVAAARIELRRVAGGEAPASNDTTTQGGFSFRDVSAGSYAVSVTLREKKITLVDPLTFAAGVSRTESLEIKADGSLALIAAPASAGGPSGGAQLSANQVSALPLNKRDFSQLLLLATGTQADTNGAANFTQQFSVNGQRGTATVFSMDGADTTDPELGGATFSNFNVDAIEDIESDSGVMPAEVGHGAAGYTAVKTKAGTNNLHGSVFEFVRNAAFDARNFFDLRSVAQPGRIPPFQRNEFGISIGGPVVVPGVYDGRNRTFYFAEWQGFRQEMGTTQVIPVPSLADRQGRDTTAFPGDTLIVPVNSAIAKIMASYPMPNDPGGSYGDRTYEISSKVATDSDQASLRLDHKLTEKDQLFARFTFDNTIGPVTNPSQTAIDPTFGVQFLDRQRNAALSYTRTVSPQVVLDSSLGFIRSTPIFPGGNHTQPGLTFGDGLYEGYDTAAGQILGAFGNLFQMRQTVSWKRGAHTMKFGAEVRRNRDTTVFGVTPNGLYTFGGGASYSPVPILSSSGAHDIPVGGLLPDSLTAFLTASPFSYTASAAPPLFAQGQHIGDSAVDREAYNFYAQDQWQVSSRLSITAGLRYEVNSRIKERDQRTSSLVFENSSGASVDAMTPGAQAVLLINNQPAYHLDLGGFGPRLAIDWHLPANLVFHAGGAITTLLPNLWQDNFATGYLPYVVTPLETAAPGAPLTFSNTVQTLALPAVYTPSGQLIYASGNSKAVPLNTPMDVLRFEQGLAALNPSHQLVPVTGQAIAQNFSNGYVGTYTAGFDRKFGDVSTSAAYVGTVGVALPRMDFPNGYAGATPGFAPYAQFNSAGQIVGGYSTIYELTNRSHSTYHSLQVSATKTSLRAGLGLQVGYTFSKSIDDTSSVLGGFLTGSSGTLLQAVPQNPRDLGAEKGPSTFDVPQYFSASVIQQLPISRLPGFRALPRRLSSGWQLLGIGSISGGSPFTVYSGIQQTGAGVLGADRPDEIAQPVLSTSRTIREDYFGLGADNASFFYIPINVPGGTGPNHGVFGTLGRNTFRGPGMHDVDLSLLKDTPLGTSRNPERAILQFRAEFFNVFNIVNFGLPSNIVLGPGFGEISRTSTPSRQIQLSLKVLF
jgi:TonB-dependent Receptor Plug Domain/TonB dependent receptor